MIDRFLRLVRRLYIPLFALLTIGLPVAVPYYYWSESLWVSFWVSFNFRFCVTLNIAFFVNSVAHMWGQRPYDEYVLNIQTRLVCMCACAYNRNQYPDPLIDCNVLRLNIISGSINKINRSSYTKSRITRSIDVKFIINHAFV